MKWLLGLAVVLVALRVSKAIVCTPMLCEGVEQEPLNCAGSVIKGGGFCGCTDICAKQEGESCGHMDLTVSFGKCEGGLSCVPQHNMMIGMGVCKSASRRVIREAVNKKSCKTDRMHKLMMMIVYQGQWIPQCEADDSYSRQQCNNIGQCFCVDTQTGEVDKGTFREGKADC
ncbi:uncharacterized protein LOC135469254 [Liolophura sinensis]|uniref:uncharacterized protein LOC135469254 n=1 Tax=Liolophura sinensis TaxID=3198878 RepID=UPI003159303B